MKVRNINLEFHYDEDSLHPVVLEYLDLYLEDAMDRALDMAATEMMLVGEILDASNVETLEQFETECDLAEDLDGDTKGLFIQYSRAFMKKLFGKKGNLQ